MSPPPHGSEGETEIPELSVGSGGSWSGEEGRQTQGYMPGVLKTHAQPFLFINRTE